MEGVKFRAEPLPAGPRGGPIFGSLGQALRRRDRRGRLRIQLRPGHRPQGGEIKIKFNVVDWGASPGQDLGNERKGKPTKPDKTV